MSNRYNNSQSAIVDQDNRNMSNAGGNPPPMSSEINAIWAAIDGGSIGITSSAADVDSVAKGGGAFTWDQNTAPGTSLLFAWFAGRFHNGLAMVTVAGGSLSLTGSATNYVELDRSGTVSSNTSGFTSGRMPLYTITTASGSYLAANVVSSKALLTLIGPAGVTGSMLSTPGATKEVPAQLGASIAATTSFIIPSPNVAATLIAARFANSTAFAGDDTNYWTWGIVNKGPSGGGSTAMLDATSTNTTKATGGSTLTAYLQRSLALSGTGANLITAAGDQLVLTLTKTGSPAALTLSSICLDFAFTA